MARNKINKISVTDANATSRESRINGGKNSVNQRELTANQNLTVDEQLTR